MIAERNMNFATKEKSRFQSIPQSLLTNTLRASRIKNHIPYKATDYTDKQKVLQLVLDERRCEFAMIGYMRYADLRRLNKEPQFAKTIIHQVGSETWELPPNNPRYIMPVPQNVLEYNPDIPQYEH